MKIFPIRHATPDWDRKDIAYDIVPGSLLTPQGENEAEALAAFLESEDVRKLYHSPFARAAGTPHGGDLAVSNARGIGRVVAVPQGDNVRAATIGRGVQGRVVGGK